MITPTKNNRIEEGEGYILLSLSQTSFMEGLELTEKVLERADCKKNRVVIFSFRGKTSWNSPTPPPKELITRAQRVSQLMNESPLILMAVIDGTCTNSCAEFVMLCDMVFSTQESVLEINSDFLPFLGGIQKAVQALGLSKAKELFLLGNLKLSREITRFTSGVFKSYKEMMEHIHNIILPQLNSLSHTAQAMTKRIINLSLDLSLEAGLAMEREMFSFAFTTSDQKEGIKAFFEKRRPNFERRECHEL